MLGAVKPISVQAARNVLNLKRGCGGEYLLDNHVHTWYTKFSEHRKLARWISAGGVGVEGGDRADLARSTHHAKE
jgi:hypothetical protein